LETRENNQETKAEQSPLQGIYLLFYEWAKDFRSPSEKAFKLKFCEKVVDLQRSGVLG